MSKGAVYFQQRAWIFRTIAREIELHLCVTSKWVRVASRWNVSPARLQTPCANLRRPTEFQWPEEDAISMSKCQVGLIQWLNHKQSNLLVLLKTPILCCQQKLASSSTSPLVANGIQFWILHLHWKWKQCWSNVAAYAKQQYCDGVFLSDFLGKGVHFIQKPLTKPRNFKDNPAPKNAP